MVHYISTCSGSMPMSVNITNSLFRSFSRWYLMKPVSHRLIEKIPLPAYLVGILASAIFFIGYFLIELNVGVVAKIISGEMPSISLRASLMLMILIGYLPVAHWYLRKWTWRHIGELNKRFNLVDARREPPEGTLVVLGIFGWLAFVVMFLILPETSLAVLRPWNWTLDYGLLVVAISCAGWWMGRFSFELVWSALQLTNVAGRLPQLNLLEPEALRPFTQHGVQSALLVVIMMSVMAPVAIQPGGGVVGAAVNSLLMVSLAVSALILPLRGIHQRIRAQKQQELEIIRRQIHREKEVLFVEASTIDNRLTAFLAMESRIERVDEWPFDVGSLSRVAFYLVLGLGSWVGAALVERVMESAL
jgi:hypothetical protein